MKKKAIVLSSVVLIVLTVICLKFNRQDHAADYFDGVQYIRVYQYVIEGDSRTRSDIILDSSYEEYNKILTAMQNAEPTYITNVFWGKDIKEKSCQVALYKGTKKVGGWQWKDDDFSYVVIYYEDLDGIYKFSNPESQNLLIETLESLHKGGNY